MTGASALVASVLPRGMPFGEPGLVALDPGSLEALAYREFPPEDFLADPGNRRRTPVRHARGLAVQGDRLFASLFNSVGEYRVADPHRLHLNLERNFTSPTAADLHGISLFDQSVAAASTGGDCVLVWDLASGTSRRVILDGATPPAGDIRFPRSRGPWRRSSPSSSHLNDVSLGAGGKLVVCSLHRVTVLSPGGDPLVLADDPGALFHDARPLDAGRILVTDGARGELIILDEESRSGSRIKVADPGEWFLRGVEILADHAYLLRSQIVQNRQLSLAERSPVRQRGASFGVSVVDLGSNRLVSETLVTLPDAPMGSVVYKIAAC